jgi:hypothetical protein
MKFIHTEKGSDMNNSSWKHLFFALITCALVVPHAVHAGRGGAIAAGILGGAAFGAAAAAASDGYYESTCYCNSPYGGPPYPCPCYYGYPAPAYGYGYPYGPEW